LALFILHVKLIDSYALYWLLMVYAVPRWEAWAWGNIFWWSNWRALRKPPLFGRGREKKNSNFDVYVLITTRTTQSTTERTQQNRV